MMWALTVGWLSVDRRLTVGFGPIQDRFEGVLFISGFRYYGIKGLRFPKLSHKLLLYFSKSSLARYLLKEI